MAFIVMHPLYAKKSARIMFVLLETLPLPYPTPLATTTIRFAESINHYTPRASAFWGGGV
jgi:hypothetical protein